MKVIKKYTAIMMGSTTIDREVNPNFTFGNVEGPYYDEKTPKEEFDTEEEAINYAFSYYKHSRWIIIPIISFEN